MDKDYITILAQNILKEVKKYIIMNNINLSYPKKEITDAKVLLIIKKFFAKNNNIKEELNEPIISSLIKYYTALYYNNLDLLNELEKNNFNWGDYKSGKMKLFVLNKEISSKFELNEYINMILNKNSKDNLNTKQVEEIKTDVFSDFNEKEYDKLTDNQKFNLNMINDRESKTAKLILELTKKYNFTKKIIFWEKFNEFFTIYEILNFKESDIEMYEYIFSNYLYCENSDNLISNAIKKLKQVKLEKPDFNYKMNALIYNLFTIKQILSLTLEDAIEEGNKIVDNNDSTQEEIDEAKDVIDEIIEIENSTDVHVVDIKKTATATVGCRFFNRTW